MDLLQNFEQSNLSKFIGSSLWLQRACVVSSVAVAIKASGLLNLIIASFTTSIEVSSKDDVFYWVKRWMDNPSHRKYIFHNSAEVRFDDDEPFIDEQKKIMFFPAVGSHLLWWEKVPIHVARFRSATIQDLNTGVGYESVTMTVLGRRNSFFVKMLEQLRANAIRGDAGKTVVYNASGSVWERSGVPRSARPLGSVVLPQSLCQRLLKEVQDFARSREWYRSRGVPWRRGILLHGPPGGGKTSLVHALAGAAGVDICFVSLSDPELTDSALDALFNSAKSGSFLLVEDIDRCAVARAEPSMSSAALTLAGLLNALDGVTSQEGRVVFLTTNHPSSIDPSLLRSGRVDLSVFIGRACEAQVRLFLRQFYQGHITSQVAQQLDQAVCALFAYIATLPLLDCEHREFQRRNVNAAHCDRSGHFKDGWPLEASFTMADLQGHCITHREDLFGALEGLVDLENRARLTFAKS